VWKKDGSGYKNNKRRRIERGRFMVADGGRSALSIMRKKDV